MKDPNGPEDRLPRGQRGEYLVAIQIALLLAFILAPVWNPWVTPEMAAALAPARWTLGLAGGAVALLLGGLGVLNIRDYLTPLPYPVDHSRLVCHGAYRVVRHPLYSSQLFAAFGWAAFNLSLSHLALMALGFAFFDFKAGKEEAWLRARHPDYADYARRVRKLIPWIY